MFLRQFLTGQVFSAVWFKFIYRKIASYPSASVISDATWLPLHTIAAFRWGLDHQQIRHQRLNTGVMVITPDLRWPSGHFSWFFMGKPMGHGAMGSRILWEATISTVSTPSKFKLEQDSFEELLARCMLYHAFSPPSSRNFLQDLWCHAHFVGNGAFARTPWSAVARQKRINTCWCLLICPQFLLT